MQQGIVVQDDSPANEQTWSSDHQENTSPISGCIKNIFQQISSAIDKKDDKKSDNV